MKKWWLFLLVGVMLAACGGKRSSSSDEEDDDEDIELTENGMEGKMAFLGISMEDGYDSMKKGLSEKGFKPDNEIPNSDELVGDFYGAEARVSFGPKEGELTSIHSYDKELYQPADAKSRFNKLKKKLASVYGKGEMTQDEDYQKSFRIESSYGLVILEMFDSDEMDGCSGVYVIAVSVEAKNNDDKPQKAIGNSSGYPSSLSDLANHSGCPFAVSDVIGCWQKGVKKNILVIYNKDGQYYDVEYVAESDSFSQIHNIKPGKSHGVECFKCDEHRNFFEVTPKEKDMYQRDISSFDFIEGRYHLWK